MRNGDTCMHPVLKKILFAGSKVIAWVVPIAFVVLSAVRLRAALIIITAPLITRNFEGKYLHSIIDKGVVIVLGITILGLMIVLESLLTKAKNFQRILRVFFFAIGGAGIVYLLSVFLLLGF